MPRPALEVSQVFSRYGNDYRELHPLCPEQHKAMRDIESCRTARLGGHVAMCTCGYTAISYNSCRNRHCPKCQSLKQAKWLEERTERLLPVRHFHLVVTLPHEMVPLTLFNRKILFNLFFEVASRALLEFAAAYERLRAHIGFTAVLHTWDQDLNFHPPSAHPRNRRRPQRGRRQMDFLKQQLSAPRKGPLKDHQGQGFRRSQRGFQKRKTAGKP